MSRKGVVILVLVLVIAYLLFNSYNASKAPVVPEVSGIGSKEIGASAGVSTYTSGVSSASLIPRDVIATEDYGQFSPDKILGNQNYLDPRSQIGYPETLGGVLRNANQQERSEPMNPRTPVSIFNLSTIPPDVMRPKFELDSGYH